MEPFTIDISQKTRDDLARRLAATIFPEPTPGPEWSRGIPPRELRALVDYWINEYDWSAASARLNRLEHFRVRLDGCIIHVARSRASKPGCLPIILTHGWPVTFGEMLPTIDTINGELDVIVPSLPGYIFSSALDSPFNEEVIADRWHELMTDVLGYERYLTYGEDVGAGVSDWLAGKYPSAVAGIIASHASFSARDRDGVDLTDEERAYFTTLDQPGESGYAHQQATRPDTLAAGLTDSPAGLLAWIAEKYAAWGPGQALGPYEPEEILTPVMLYWATKSIGTSFRAYAEPSSPPHPVIEAPASLVIQQREAGYPRSLGEKSYRDIRSFDSLDSGGHFPAWKAPEQIARAILEHEASL